MRGIVPESVLVDVDRDARGGRLGVINVSAFWDLTKRSLISVTSPGRAEQKHGPNELRCSERRAFDTATQCGLIYRK